jgi:muramidase (phage lysozyme)
MKKFLNGCKIFKLNFKQKILVLLIFNISCQKSIFNPEEKNNQGQNPPKEPSSQTAPAKAFLNTIAYAEGTPKFGTEDGYNVMFTGKIFSSYNDHPRQIQVSGKLKSDAAGRYQFLSTTWDRVKKMKSLLSFEPAQQDLAGLALLEIRGVFNYNNKLSRDEFRNALGKIGKEWASIPGSPYGQPVKTFDELWEVYEKNF